MRSLCSWLLSSQWIFTSLLPSVADASSATCHCTSDTACWPALSDFAELASHVSQPLLYPVPPASACYPSTRPSGDCAATQQGWFDGNWRANQSGATQEPNFETFTERNGTISACFIETSLGAPCTQGSVPVTGVDARSVADVQAAVRFAADHNLRLVVKNTGHDYLGRSTARGSFMIWTHNMKNITFLKSYKPVAAPDNSSAYSDVIQLGVGVQWHEAYAAAQAQGRVIVGGASNGGSVGAAGGWLMGGGHSPLAPRYGLGVDNVIEMNIVTASGQHLTVNSHQHADLFWALRGGGGGTYGVVTSVIYKTHPSLPLTAAVLFATVNGTSPSPSLHSLFTEVVRTTPALLDAGWSGYTAASVNTTARTFTFAMELLAYNVSAVAANASISPLFEFAQSIADATTSRDDAMTLSALTVPLDSLYTWFTDIFTPGEQVLNGEIGSRLLSRDAIVQNYTQIADILLPLPNMQYYLLGGGAVNEVDPSSTGLNPAWRKTLVHTVFDISWSDGTPASTIQAQRAVLKSQIDAITAVTPGSGAYLNEAFLGQPNPQFSFFGTHYHRLRAIKARYDPNSLFLVPKGVGSDEWDTELLCRL